MNLPTLAFAAFALAIVPAQADGIDTSKLVRFSDLEGVTHEDWVSTDPVSTAIVKKIEAGRVSYVNITTTATGTYSTDGIESPNVQYPGVYEDLNTQNYFSFSSWSNGSWNRFRAYNGNSYVSISTYKRHNGTTRTSTCISTASFWYC